MKVENIIVLVIAGIILGGFVGFGIGQWISPRAHDYYGGGQIGGPVGCLALGAFALAYGLTRKRNS